MTTPVKTTMNLGFGTRVYYGDQPCGKLAYIAVDPTTQHVMEIVVEDGLPFFKHNRVVPFRMINDVTADAIQLTLSGNDWEDYPEYREVDIEEPDPTARISTSSLRSEGVIDFRAPLIHRRLRQGIVAERAILHAGTPITGSDGVAGQLDHLLVERTMGQITHLTLRRGLLQREYIVVPVEELQISSDSSIQLNATTAALADLPHYHQRGEDEILVDLETHLRAEAAAFATVHANMADGVVQLTGHVPSRALQVHAAELARTIPGVREVKNEIQVGTGDPPLLPTDPTDEVAAAVHYALTTDARTRQSQIAVNNNNGVIHLRGQVGTLAEQRLAENLAATQPGVTGVVNELTVRTMHAETRQPVAA